MLKVTSEVWLERLSNLYQRRTNGVTDSHHLENKIADYGSHVSKIRVGAKVLDVGCGSMEIKKHLKPGTAYLGIDWNPVSDEVVKMKIEDCYFDDGSFDTIFCFAVLDGLEDFDKAIYHMRRICKKNILFLTGIGIPPDKYHTLEIKEEYLTSQMFPFKVGYRKYLQEKVLLIEYKKL